MNTQRTIFFTVASLVVILGSSACAECGAGPADNPDADSGSSVHVDAGTVDAEVMGDSGSGDAIGTDAARDDAAVVDSSMDSGTTDSSGADARVLDAAAADTGETDATAPDAGQAEADASQAEADASQAEADAGQAETDASNADAGALDGAAGDAVTDSGPADSATVDVEPGDVGAPDSGVSDLGGADSGAADVEPWDHVSGDAGAADVSGHDVATVPVFVSTPPASGQEGLLYTYAITCSDADGDVLTLAVGPADGCGGEVIDEGGGLGSYSFTPSETQGGGSCALEVSCSGGGDTVFSVATVTVAEVNSAPLLDNLADTRIAAIAVPEQFVVQATDTDVPANGLTFSQGDSSCTFDVELDSSSGELAWTCDAIQTCTLELTVTDDGTPAESDTQLLTIDCRNSEPEVTSIAPDTASEGLLYSYAISCSDANGDALTLALGDGDSCAGEVVDSGEGLGTYLLTALESQGGADCVVEVTCFDGLATATQSTTIAVLEVNLAPQIANLPAERSTAKTSHGTFTALATDADLPANTLTWSLGVNGCGFTPQVFASSGEVSWTCVGVETCAFEITVDDQGSPNLSDTQALTITCTNTSPIFTSSAATQVSEGDLYQYDITCTDADGDSVTLAVGDKDSCGGELIDDGDGTGSYSFTPGELAGGSACTVAITCTDGEANVGQSAEVSQLESNSLPTWEHLTYDVTLLVSEVYSDVNGAAVDSDQPAAHQDDPGYLDCHLQSSDCSFAVTVSGSAAAAVGCQMDFVAGADPETCEVRMQVVDGSGGILSRSARINVLAAPANIIYVDAAATDAGDGSSWEQAYNNVQTAVTAASSGTFVFIAEGTYTETGAVVVTLKNGVSLYGGFDGQTSLATRGNPALHPSVLDGQGQRFSVVVGKSGGLMDGLTITGGYQDLGGGMANRNITSLSVTNCLFVANATYGSEAQPYGASGAAMFNWSVVATISNCVFANNNSAGSAGAIDLSFSPDFTILNSVFTDNVAAPPEGYNTQPQGGALYVVASTVLVRDCVFEGNTATYGAALSLNTGSDADIRGCVLQDNHAARWGSAVFLTNGTASLTDSLLVDNSAKTWGGGLYVSSSGTASVSQCTFVGNSCASNGGGLYAEPSASVAVVNSIFWGDSKPEIHGPAAVTFSAVEGGRGGEGNIELDPAFVGHGDYRLLGDSPCVDSGSAAGATDRDLDGQLRPSCRGYDMGAHERLCPSYEHTITIDGIDDFADGEALATSSTGYTGYAAWDDTFLYLGMEGPDVAADSSTKWLLVYLGTTGGSTTGQHYGSQQPELAFEASTHIRWKTDNTYTNTQVYAGDSWQDAAWDWTDDIYQLGSFVELRVPLADIGAPRRLKVHMSMIDEDGEGEWTWAAVPESSLEDGADPDHATYLEFDLQGTAVPAAYPARP